MSSFNPTFKQSRNDAEDAYCNAQQANKENFAREEDSFERKRDERIVALIRQQMSCRSIVKELKREKFQVSKTHVGRLLKNFKVLESCVGTKSASSCVVGHLQQNTTKLSEANGFRGSVDISEIVNVRSTSPDSRTGSQKKRRLDELDEDDDSHVVVTNSNTKRRSGLFGETTESRAGLFLSQESRYHIKQSPSVLQTASLGQREILSVISPNFANVGSAKRDTRPSIGHAPLIHLMPISREARPLYNETSTQTPETTERVRNCAKVCRLNLTWT
jgi:arginine repressor